ncbi:MAG: hypothetical protein JSV31_17235 [Desulfobacterales bacterium]|nr:MAG: hypothetical protein JSV31_17235 [Desulfobacterales bacterium]
MRVSNLILIICLGFFSYPLEVQADRASAASSLFVFKLDGTTHCEDAKGVSLDSMQQELTTAGIKVISRQKGYDGREGIAVCGAPTGQINIYEIASSDVSAALGLGFRQLPENWIRED